MSQTWVIDCFDLDDAGHLDLTDIENNFACLYSLFSGINEPSDKIAGMPWFDITNKVLRVRNASNDGWLGIFYGTINQRCIFYRNDAEEGWIVDTTNIDKIVAIKNYWGGTYQVGGTVAGSWNMTGYTAFVHLHAYSHYHVVPNSETEGWHQHSVLGGTSNSGSALIPCYHASGHGHVSSTSVTYTGVPNTNVIISDSTWRPAACVSTVQYMNI